MAKTLPRSVYRAINRAMTPGFNRWAKKTYGMTGKRLLAKVAAVEGGGSIDEGTSATSYAGARGPFQFISSTRSRYIQAYGVDPWKNDLSAAKGAMIHLKGTGIRGYNPGLPEYEGMVLSADVDTRPLRTGSNRGGGSSAGGVRLRRSREGSTISRQPGGWSIRENVTPGVSMKSEREALKKETILNAVSQGRMPTQKELLGMAIELKGLQDVPPESDIDAIYTPGKTSIKGMRQTQQGTIRGGGVGGVSPQRIRRGKWGGSKLAGRSLVKLAGLPVTSRKRSTQLTASGGVSDHYIGNKDSYAWDMGVSGAEGTRIARKLARQLGVKNWDGGSWLNVTRKIGGVPYRFQIGWNVEGHYDHIHMGVDRADIPG